MRAVVHDRYGPPEVLRLEEVPRPVPADDQVLVRIHATSVNRTDAGLRSAELPISRAVTGLLRPRQRILGTEFAGEVVEIGKAVSQLSSGDRVFGASGSGAHAEYLAIRESGPIARIPAGIGFDEAAAATDGAALALACFRQADLRAGQRLLVYGASGAVGTAGVQLAKHIGAHVTAVIGTENVELARSLGADEVIDYKREDFTKNGERYDVIFDAVGMLSFNRARRSLRPGGTLVDTDLGYMFHLAPLVLLTRWVGDRKVKMGITKYAKEDVELIARLLESGEFRAIIDRRYPLDEVVEATRYVETGQKVGNVVLLVTDPSAANA